MAKQIYIKQSDTYSEVQHFNRMATPMGLGADQAMPADCAPPSGMQKANAYDGGANSKSASE